MPINRPSQKQEDGRLKSRRSLIALNCCACPHLTRMLIRGIGYFSNTSRETRSIFLGEENWASPKPETPLLNIQSLRRSTASSSIAGAKF
jgi:hypothetical protein